ncbi:MAG: hypothetical protein AABZ60_12225 [Planctomycetota bacterium]|mgnify:CR=1 FL=1
MRYFYSLITFVFLSVYAQHCGPFIGIETSTDSNKNYRISLVREKRNPWNYLAFTVQENLSLPKLEQIDQKVDWDVVPVKFSFKLPILDYFYKAYIFVSPTGNGFVVTGFPYYTVYGSKKQDDPILLHFYTMEGKLQKELKLQEVATPEEISFCGSHQHHSDQDLWGNFLAVSKAEGCVIYYTFADRPRLSEEGQYLEFCMAKTRRSISFFLPLQMLVTDKSSFESELESWLTQDNNEKTSISLDFRKDLNLFQVLLSYPNVKIQNATITYLCKRIPEPIHPKEKEPALWNECLEKYKNQLQWEEDSQHYRSK